MAEKKTEMVLKVDLQCPCCYKKVKKLLCKYPEIRDQRFDEKANTVSIIVVTCCPEKIRDKLCYKGGKVIKSIEIKEPPKAKPEKPKDQEKPKGPEKPKDQDKPKDAPKEKPKEAAKPKDQEKPKESVKPKDQEKPKESGKPKDNEKPKDQEKPKPAPEKSAQPKAHPPVPAHPPMLQPMQGMPPMQGMMQPMPGMVAVQAAQGFPPPVETGYAFMPGYGESYHNGAYNHGYGLPVVAAPPSYDYYGQNYGGYGKPAYVHRDEYFSEENSQGCSIM